jgi:hypothetical protein
MASRENQLFRARAVGSPQNLIGRGPYQQPASELPGSIERLFSGEGGIEVTDAVDTRSGTDFVRRRDVLENENHIDEGIAIAFHPVIPMKNWPGNP